MPQSPAMAFVSYSRNDSEFVLRLIGDLRRAGAQVWLDQNDIPAGTNWDSMIEQALQKSSAVLLVLSPASAKNENVRNEISYALQEKKTIIPILYLECVIPLQLHRLQQVDFRTDYARGLAAVIDLLNLTDKKSLSQAAPGVGLPQAADSPLATPSETEARMDGIIPRRRWPWAFGLAAVMGLILFAGAAQFLYRHAQSKHWSQAEAPQQIDRLLGVRTPLAAIEVLERAQAISPSDATLLRIAETNTVKATIESSPSGVFVWMQDYLTPNGPWKKVGITPIQDVYLPRGFFRWRLSVKNSEVILSAYSSAKMKFALEATLHAPPEMVSVPAGYFGNMGSNIGWFGGKLPSFYIDRFEVTNRDFQKFVDGGGYEKRQYWTEKFVRNGSEISWQDAMKLFRDSTDRPGPADWVGGHFPEGRENYPVSGVSWFEASAYAAFASKSLPVFAQWVAAAPLEESAYVIPPSNISTNGLAPVGAYKGVGLYGTYDMAGNVREWVVNAINGNLRPLLGGSWRSPNYEYYLPEAFEPFNRSEENGFRCVRNIDPIPPELAQPLQTITRDFVHFKPASDEVFNAYRALYDYPKLPLNEKSDGIVQETLDWRVEKVEFATAYHGERMAAYLYLPKNVTPPYQTVLFFPSARIMGIDSSDDGKALDDLKFFNYVVQSGRAVMYPIYQDTYERHLNYQLPGGSQPLELSTERYKDAARALDYLSTRKDIDNGKLSYLGVSMGSAFGIIATTLLQDRLRAAVFLDGGYFLDPAPTGGDQADFAPRMRKPVLMINGRYDFTFGVEASQKPLFDMLGTPPADKRHIVLDTAHDVNEQRPQLVQAVLGWLDKYVGPVH